MVETSPSAIPGLVIAETHTEYAIQEVRKGIAWTIRVDAETDLRWWQRKYPNRTFRVVSRQVFTTEWAEQ